MEVKQLELGASGTIPCDHEKNDPEVRVVQWYKSRNIDTFVNSDPSLASWGKGATESQPNYHIEHTTFSLIIDKATLEDEGLFKCSVERGDLFTESSYYTRTEMYALPRMDPNITLDTDLNHVHCTVEHVKPLNYPVFNFDCIPDSTETNKYAVAMNEDGTYTTSVSCTLPQTKSASLVDCSFSYLHYHGVGSLDLRDMTTYSPMEYITTTVSPMATSVTFAGDGCRAIDLTIVLGIVIGLLIAGYFIMLIRWIKSRTKCHRGVQIRNKAKESKSNIIQPAMEMEA